MAEEFSSLSGSDFARLVPQTITILKYLRQKEPRSAADLIIDSKIGGVSKDEDATLDESTMQARVDSLEKKINKSAKQILHALGKDESNDMSARSMNLILSNYSSGVWAECVKLILTKSTPPLFPLELCRQVLDNVKMFQRYSEDTDDIRELYNEFIRTFENLPTKSYFAAAELCALIRDCSTSRKKVANELGPKLLVHSGIKLLDDNIEAAQFIMRRMVIDCESLFGQHAVKSSFYALGVRGSDRGTSSRKTAELHRAEKYMPKGMRRKKDLKVFYLKVDKRYQDSVEKLFEFHDFVNIAHALYLKYQLIPDPWKRQLQNMKNKGIPMKWFDYDSILSPTEAGTLRSRHRQRAGSVLKASRTNSSMSSSSSKKLSKPKRSFRLTRNSSSASLGSVNSISTVRSSTRRRRELIARDLFPMDVGVSSLSDTDAILDRFLDAEWEFFCGVRDFGTQYLQRVKQTAQQDQNSPAAENLNLSIDEISILFGERWKGVLDFR